MKRAAEKAPGVADPSLLTGDVANIWVAQSTVPRTLHRAFTGIERTYADFKLASEEDMTPLYTSGNRNPLGPSAFDYHGKVYSRVLQRYHVRMFYFD